MIVVLLVTWMPFPSGPKVGLRWWSCLYSASTCSKNPLTYAKKVVHSLTLSDVSSVQIAFQRKSMFINSQRSNIIYRGTLTSRAFFYSSVNDHLHVTAEVTMCTVWRCQNGQIVWLLSGELKWLMNEQVPWPEGVGWGSKCKRVVFGLDIWLPLMPLPFYYDAASTLNQHWFNVSRLLGSQQNATHWTNVVLMLAHRLQLWANINRSGEAVAIRIFCECSLMLNFATISYF